MDYRPDADTDARMRDYAHDAPQNFHPSWQPGTEGAPFSPGISLDGSSPSLTWRPDEFTLSQGYQAYKEELRSLIFNTANSAVPTRQGSPDAAGEQDGLCPLPSIDERRRRETAEILAVNGRVEYLRNYVAQVAPWVRSHTLTSPKAIPVGL